MSCWSDSLFGICTSLLNVTTKTRQVKLHKALPIMVLHCCCSYINSVLELTLSSIQFFLWPQSKKRVSPVLCLPVWNLQFISFDLSVSPAVISCSHLSAYSKELWSPLPLSWGFTFFSHHLFFMINEINAVFSLTLLLQNSARHQPWTVSPFPDTHVLYSRLQPW